MTNVPRVEQNFVKIIQNNFLTVKFTLFKSTFSDTKNRNVTNLTQIVLKELELEI